MKSNTNRGNEWIEFSKTVLNHIDTYTVPQYGDANWDHPEKGDQMQTASLEDMQMNLKRYINRLNSNARGKIEALRDLNKIAHYACLIWGNYDRGNWTLDNIKEEKFIFTENTSDEEIHHCVNNILQKILENPTKYKIVLTEENK